MRACASPIPCLSAFGVSMNGQIKCSNQTNMRKDRFVPGVSFHTVLSPYFGFDERWFSLTANVTTRG